MDPEGLLADLNDEQRAAVTSEHAPLAIIAGAGSGKTRVLTRRVAWQAATERIDPRRALVLTFTRKAAGELTDRLRALGLRDSVSAGTFHAVAYAQLRRMWADQKRPAPELLDRKLGVVARALGSRSSDSALEVVGEIEWAKARLVSPDRYPAAAAEARRRPSCGVDEVARAFRGYEELKRKQKLVDFDDLLALCRHALDTDLELAAAQRWRVRHLFVDEFQDVNPLQFALLRSWLGDGGDLCVVGDPNQAIYAWNGADADFLARFDEWFPGGGTARLRRNHRSTPQILHLAGSVLRSGKAVATRPDGPIPQIRGYDDEWAEARGITRALRDRHAPGARWSDQSVLVRTNAQVEVIEQVLRSSGIPCRTRAGSGLLDRPEVAAILRRWRRADRVTLAAALTELGTGVESEIRPDDEGEAASDGDAERQASLEALERIARDHLALDPECSASRFVAFLSASRASGFDDPNADVVDLATFHAAKGLEWKVVHLAGIEEGLVPISHAKSTAERAEEQRLLYVALTRAEDEVSISFARSRTVARRERSREPSPWLDPLATAVADLRGVSRPVGDRESVANVRDQLRSRARPSGRAPVDETDPLRQALREWRRLTAKAADVPAYVVFADATLDDLVARRPTSERTLLDVTGLGPVKVTRYGADILAMVRDHQT